MKNKKLDNKFFTGLTGLLVEYVSPKSRIVSQEINNIVRSVCRSHGYEWIEKCEAVNDS